LADRTRARGVERPQSTRTPQPLRQRRGGIWLLPWPARKNVRKEIRCVGWENLTGGNAARTNHRSTATRSAVQVPRRGPVGSLLH
jgi:hypothetical protein